MPKYILHMAYDGRRYAGWQFQSDEQKNLTIQGQLEKALHQIFGERVITHGCGRTDKGVHASQYFVQFAYNKVFDFDLKFRLNKLLYDDIAIIDYWWTGLNVHVQRDAISRTYRYYFHSIPNPFLNSTSLLVPNLSHWNLQTINLYCQTIEQTQDFTLLCRQPEKANHTTVEIHNVRFCINHDKTQAYLEITANRFLRQMIRMIVDQLLQIIEGGFTLEGFINHLENNIAFPHPKAIHPHGLHLHQVSYPYLSLTNLIEDRSFETV